VVSISSFCLSRSVAVVGLSAISSCYFVGCSINETLHMLTAYCPNFSHRPSQLFDQFSTFKTDF
jgi:hypothetical protein